MMKMSVFIGVVEKPINHSADGHLSFWKAVPHVYANTVVTDERPKI